MLIAKYTNGQWGEIADIGKKICKTDISAPEIMEIWIRDFFYFDSNKVQLRFQGTYKRQYKNRSTRTRTMLVALDMFGSIVAIHLYLRDFDGNSYVLLNKDLFTQQVQKLVEANSVRFIRNVRSIIRSDFNH